MKKMRRMIPALCMLLVSAIMLTTASYAWFTMNEEVTASGMQVKAKADGSLLISTVPFDENNLGKSDVEINPDVHTLKPMKYNSAASATGMPHGWIKPADASVSSSVTGANNGAFEAIASGDSVTTTIREYAFFQEFYLATAGEASAKDITITLTSPVHQSEGETYKAYSAAIYVFDESVDVDDGTLTNQWEVVDASNLLTKEPDHFVHVGESDEAGNNEDRNTITIKGKTIPSIAAAVDGNKVGLKIVVCFYVDGALQSTVENERVLLGYDYVAATTYDDTKAYYAFTEVEDISEGGSLVGYYYLNNDVMTPAKGTKDADDDNAYFVRSENPVSLTDEEKAGEGLSNYYVFKLDNNGNLAPQYDTVPYAYVRTNDIPSVGSTLTLTFASDVTLTNN